MLSPNHTIQKTPERNDLACRKSLSTPSPRAYHDLHVIRKLSKTKFPVYLTISKIDRQHYAMKMFPYAEDDCHENFKNEIRFSSLKHPNIINMIYAEERRDTIRKGELNRVSYILMEYAPHGDFFEFITKHRDQIDDKLARTYFRQLIDGIEYLHGNGIAHLDLKPENFLLGADFNLKIIDFDLSFIYGDAKVVSNGTKYYRAPELFRSGSSNTGIKVPFAADIYSAGIFLFIMKSGGMYPHAEDDMFDGINFSELMYQDNKKFWTYHSGLQGKKEFFDRSFKELFNNMLKLSPEKRSTIRQIKQSKWYKGPVYTPVELQDKMTKILNC